MSNHDCRPQSTTTTSDSLTDWRRFSLSPGERVGACPAVLSAKALATAEASPRRRMRGSVCTGRDALANEFKLPRADAFEFSPLLDVTNLTCSELLQTQPFYVRSDRLKVKSV